MKKIGESFLAVFHFANQRIMAFKDQYVKEQSKDVVEYKGRTLSRTIEQSDGMHNPFQFAIALSVQSKPITNQLCNVLQIGIYSESSIRSISPWSNTPKAAAPRICIGTAEIESEKVPFGNTKSNEIIVETECSE